VLVREVWDRVVGACVGLRALRGVKRGHGYAVLYQDEQQRQELRRELEQVVRCKRRRIRS
jgi:hypothetical protein